MFFNRTFFCYPLFHKPQTILSNDNF